MTLYFTAARGSGISISAVVGGAGAQADFNLLDFTVTPAAVLPPTAVLPSSSRWDIDWPTITAKGWDGGGVTLCLQATLKLPTSSTIPVLLAVAQPAGTILVARDDSTNPPTPMNGTTPPYHSVQVGSGTPPNRVDAVFFIYFV